MILVCLLYLLLNQL